MRSRPTLPTVTPEHRRLAIRRITSPTDTLLLARYSHNHCITTPPLGTARRRLFSGSNAVYYRSHNKARTTDTPVATSQSKIPQEPSTTAIKALTDSTGSIASADGGDRNTEPDAGGPDGGGGGANGGAGARSNRHRNDGSGGDDSHSSGASLHLTLLSLAAAVAGLGALATLCPAPAAAAAVAAAAPGDSMATLRPPSQPPPQPHEPSPPGRPPWAEEDTQRFKRLLREAFAELTDLRARLDAADAAAAEAAAAEAEGWVVPLEGLSVRPYARRLAADTRLRSRAQVSGSIDAVAVAPLAASEDSLTGLAAPDLQADPLDRSRGGAAGDGGWATAATPSGAAPGGPTGMPPSAVVPPPAAVVAEDWYGMLRAAGIRSSATPRLRLRIQSVWGNANPHGSAAEGTAVGSPVSVSGAGAEDATLLGGQERQAGRGAAAGGQQQQRRRRGQGSGGGEGLELEEARPVAAHLQLETGPDGRGLVVDKLLLKAEAHPRLKVLLATQGSLDNIGMNVNPFAGAGELQRGLTTATRRGHDLTLLSRGGLGAAVSAKTGALAAAVGAFTGPTSTSTSTSTGNPWGGSGDPAAEASNTASTTTASTTCGQLSLHRSRRFVLTAACAASTLTDAPSAASPAPTHGSAWEGRERRELQRGLIGTMLLAEGLSAAAWVGDAATSRISSYGTGYDSPGGGAGGGGSCRTSGGGGGGGGGDGGGSVGPLGAWAETQPAATSGSGSGLPPGALSVAPAARAGADDATLRQRRVGVRLSTLPDEETGRSFALSVSHRSWRTGGNGGGGTRPTVSPGDRVAASRRGTGSLLIAEASASLPVAHGVVVTPGLVLLVGRRHAFGGSGGGDAAGDGDGDGGGSFFAAGSCRKMLCATAQTTWSF